MFSYGSMLTAIFEKLEVGNPSSAVLVGETGRYTCFRQNFDSEHFIVVLLFSAAKNMSDLVSPEFLRNSIAIFLLMCARLLYAQRFHMMTFRGRESNTIRSLTTLTQEIFTRHLT